MGLERMEPISAKPQCFRLSSSMTKTKMMMRMLLMILMMMTMVIHRNPGCMAKLGLVALPVQTLIKVFNLFQTFTRYIAAFKLMGERESYKLFSAKYSFSLQLRASLLQWEPKIGWTGLLVGHVLSFTTGGQLCLVWTQKLFVSNNFFQGQYNHRQRGGQV